jgi:hypothetical protein
MSKNIPRNLMSIDISMILYEIKGYKKGEKVKRERGEKGKMKNRGLLVLSFPFPFYPFPLFPHRQLTN